jgi:phage replication-related protein YjqB (UPF0714/DUF867 family)
VKKTVQALLLVSILLATRAVADEANPEVEQASKYSSYTELAREMKSGIDFEVIYRNSGSRSYLIAAPHGGYMEPGSTEIANAIADDLFGFYTFSSIRRNTAPLMVLPSLRFNEPWLRSVSKRYRGVISIHIIPGSDRAIYVGGTYRKLANIISSALQADGYTVKTLPNWSPAYNSNNFFNKGVNGGIRIEISSGLVYDMFRGPVENPIVRLDPLRRTSDFRRFVRVVQNSIMPAANPSSK